MTHIATFSVRSCDHMANITSNAAIESLVEQDKMIYIAIDSSYILLSTLALIGNSMIIAVFLSNSALRNRKEFLLLVALAAADLIFCGSLAAIGGRRLFVVTREFEIKLITTRFDCMLRFEQIFFTFAAQASPLMTFCISVDRLVAITFFQIYDRFHSTYFCIPSHNFPNQFVIFRLELRITEGGGVILYVFYLFNQHFCIEKFYAQSILFKPYVIVFDTIHMHYLV